MAKKSKSMYERAGILSIEEGLQLIRKESELKSEHRHGAKINGANIHSLSTQRCLTYLSGITCKHCGLTGAYWAIEKFKYSNKKMKKRHIPNTVNQYHLNLYGVDRDGVEVMLTSDHIIPRSAGGTGDPSNRQVLCMRCNTFKGNKSEEEVQQLLNKGG